jgi:hypothetical protein
MHRYWPFSTWIRVAARSATSAVYAMAFSAGGGAQAALNAIFLDENAAAFVRVVKALAGQALTQLRHKVQVSTFTFKLPNGSSFSAIVSAKQPVPASTSGP